MPKQKTPPPLFTGSHHLRAWQKCYNEWLIACQERTGSDATVASYRCEMQHFFVDPHKAPEHYTRDDVAAFIRSPVRAVGQITRPPAPCTQNRRLATIKSFYDFAAQYYVLFHARQRPIMGNHINPCTGIHVIQTGHSPKGLTEAELHRLFAAIPRDTVVGLRDFALFSFYFWLARRRCEVLRLRWGDIYEVIFVENGVERVGHMYRYSSKGHSRDIFRAVLEPEAYEALIAYLKASGRYEHMQPDSPLFTATYWQPGPEKPLHWTVVCPALQRYAKAAGIRAGSGRKITTHWLRHTRAQLQWLDDPSEKALTRIQKLLGHASVATTLIYLAGAEEKPDDAGARLAQKLGKL